MEMNSLIKLLNGRVRWLLVFWMFLIGAVAYLDRVNISMASQALQKEHALTDIQLGWVFSGFLFGYALFQVPGGRFADRFGPRRVIVLAVLWWSVFTTLTALVPARVAFSLILLIGVRFVLGVGEAVVYPSSNLLVARWIPSGERGLANGIIFAGVGAGAGLTPPLIIWILTNWGWRWSFYISALIGLTVGAVWLLLAHDSPSQHPLISPEEADTIKRGLPAVAATGEQQEAVFRWRSVLGSRNVWAITFSYFTYGYVAYIFFTWFFTYLSRERGMDLKSSAFYSMLPFIAMASAAPLGGWVADWIVRRRGRRAGRCGVALVAMILAAVFLSLATVVESVRIVCLVLAGGAGALYLAQSAFWAVSADIAGSHAGTVSGFMNMGSQVGGALTAVFTPWVASHYGWTPSFLVAAGLAFMGAMAWILVDPEKRIVNAQPQHPNQ